MVQNVSRIRTFKETEVFVLLEYLYLVHKMSWQCDLLNPLGGSLWLPKNKTCWWLHRFWVWLCCTDNFSLIFLKRCPPSPSKFDDMTQSCLIKLQLWPVQKKKKCTKKRYIMENVCLCVCLQAFMLLTILCWGFDLLAVLQPFDLNIGIHHFTLQGDFLALIHWVARLKPL